jgi:hypothetical protein
MKPGDKLGKYEVREKVAVGGMATIYKAYDPTLDRLVAIKQIAPNLSQDERFVERFRVEAQTLAKLSASQANIVHVHELIQQDGQLFLIMEFVEGTTLRALMDRGPMPLQTGLGVLLSTALGLKAMHGQGIVHRDLTPSNIMMAKDGALKITDFGLIGHSGGKTSLPMGTTKYMAPEMFTGAPVDARADVYSLGMIAYEMFIGPDKFADAFKDVLRDEKAQQVRWMHWHSNPALRAPSLRDLQPGIPPLVAKIVDRMIEKDPSKRFASADQIIRWLRRIFVMHVQGKSISQTESESLEKELAAETAGTTVPAVRMDRPSAAPAARPGTPGAARSAAPTARPGKAGTPGAVQAVTPPAGTALVRPRPGAGSSALVPAAAGPLVPSTAEKTAPLPKPKMSVKIAVILASIILGVFFIVGGGMWWWQDYKFNLRVDQAKKIQADGDEQWHNRQYDAAEKIFGKMATEFTDRGLDSFRDHAKEFQYMSLAESDLAKKMWTQADENRRMAVEKYHATTTWNNDFQKRFRDSQFVDQRMKDVEVTKAQKKWPDAIEMLEDLQKKVPDLATIRPDLKVADDIAELREKIMMGDYRDLMDQARAALAKNDIVQARELALKAKEKRETAEVLVFLDELNTIDSATKFQTEAERAEKAQKWEAAASAWEQYYKIRPTAQVRTKINHDWAQKYTADAEVLEATGDPVGAQKAWRKVLQFEPTNTKALAKVKEFGVEQNIAQFSKDAKEAFEAHQWQQAINSYKNLIGCLEVTNPKHALIKTDAEAQIVEATRKMNFEQAQAAFAAGEYERALELAQLAGDSDEVKNFVNKVDRRVRASAYIKEGKAFMAQIEYLKALTSFENAAKVEATQETKDLIFDANFYRYYAKAQSLAKDGLLLEAQQTGVIASKYAHTERQKLLIGGYLDNLKNQPAPKP